MGKSSEFPSPKLRRAGLVMVVEGPESSKWGRQKGLLTNGTSVHGKVQWSQRRLHPSSQGL